MIASYEGKTPRIGKDVFVAPTAYVIGDVEIGDGSSIWYGAVVRGDRAKIKIGRNTIIEDNATLHADPERPLVIGDYVPVGHNAVIHGYHRRRLPDRDEFVIRVTPMCRAVRSLPPGRCEGRRCDQAFCLAELSRDQEEPVPRKEEEPAERELVLARPTRRPCQGPSPMQEGRRAKNRFHSFEKR